MLDFFGEEYAEYQEKVPIGIPFIQGYMGEGRYLRKAAKKYTYEKISKTATEEKLD